MIQKMHMVLASYLFFRIPILKPDRFLSRTLDGVKTIFNRWTFTLLWTIAITGYICLIMNLHQFADVFIKSISFQGLARYSIAVVLIKFVHEFAHAYTARIFGVRVRRMGLAFIVFIPRLYTDLTDSWRLASRKKRFLIIISEIIIGGGAALVWANTPPGVTQTVAYYIFAVSIINTVLINGNPFIRYDGYYMLMDLTGIDNLQQRGIERVKNLWRKYLFGIKLPLSDNSSGWKLWFVVLFGICAFIYKFFLYTSIIMIVYFKFTKTLGIVLLVLEVYLLVFKPLKSEIKFLIMARKKVNRRKLILSSVGAAVLLLGMILPLPWDVQLPCEVKPADSDIVSARCDGFIESLPVKDGQQVNRGQLLMLQRNPYLAWRKHEAEINKKISRIEVDQAQSDNRRLGQVKVNMQAWRDSNDMLKELERKQAILKVKSSLDGTFVLWDRHLKPGKWLVKGEVIGEVFRPDRNIVSAYITEDDIRKIKLNDKVKICLDDEINWYTGRITAVNPVPAAMRATPLLQPFGGSIICYPVPGGLFKPLQSCYQVDIMVDGKRKLPTGRTGVAVMRKYTSLGGNIFRKVLTVLQRELSF
ncbi:MAG: HlyD family efflux transporter periplasmic adaptor subunit [Lentisphaerae bacterium]|nr:HlyD family efflux transporter periplasmic adaptor subunit [Lentisphaerota bacterium]MCP4100798.1 HlyD family efflux transporter periplasmic adaptor subunit [Lentisphaerota bacterium]